MRHDIKKGDAVAWLWQSGGTYGCRVGTAVKLIPRCTGAIKFCAGNVIRSFERDIDVKKDRFLILAMTKRGPRYYCRPADSTTVIKEPARFIGWLDRVTPLYVANLGENVE